MRAHAASSYLEEGDSNSLCARHDRQQARIAKHAEDIYDSQVRAAAHAAALTREAEEAGGTLHSIEPAGDAAQPVSPEIQYIQLELAEVRNNVPDGSLRLCSSQGVHMQIQASTYRSMTLKLFFPSTYPASSLAIELSSATLHEELLHKMRTAAANEANKRSGSHQVLPVIQILTNILQSNILAAAYIDLQHIRRLLNGSNGQLVSAKEKSGKVQV